MSVQLPRYWRIALVALVAVCAAVTVVGPVLEWQDLQTVCFPHSACWSYQLGPAAAYALTSHGISMTMYAAFNVLVPMLCFGVWIGVGALILWRGSSDRGALTAGAFLIGIPLLGSLANALPSGRISSLAGTATVVAIVLFCLLFPDGRFVSRWAVALALAFGAFLVASLVPHPPGGPAVLNLLPVLLIMLIVVAQVYRYRRASTWVQRQQTKVAMFGLAIAVMGLGLLWAPYGIAPFPTGPGTLYNSLSNVSGPVIVLTALPVAIGLAVLRSGLWDIDRVISRALVYSTLSITLAGIYIGSVIGLQAAIRAVSGQQSELAVALSTLVIAALFNPLRHRIQDVIARTFSRQKYNAQQVLAAFGATCRDEADLEQLQARMLRVVGEAMQPATVSLWLRETPEKG